MIRQPLEEYSVLDLSQGVAGPTAGAMLADFGADVVSIEPPGGATQRYLADGSAFPNVSRNKDAIVVDLKTEKGSRIIHKLAAEADALIESNRPGKMAEFDCDYDSLAEINPELVYCSITGYGEEGPYRDRPGIDPLAQAVSGLMWMTGEPDRKPSRIGGPTIDVATGINAAFATLTAMVHAQKTGEGQKVESTLFDTAAMIMSNWYTKYSKDGSVPERQGHSWEVYAPSGVFKTGTQPVYIAVPAQPYWERLCRAVDRRDWIDDDRFSSNDDRLANQEQLFAEMEAEFETYDRDDLLAELIAAGVPASEVKTVQEAAEDGHLRERGTVRKVEDSEGEEVLVVQTPVKFSKTPGRFDQVAPDLGADTRAVLRKFGFTEEEIDDFVAASIVEEA
jgi:crotonobetainyl-CoA:carnitine CoA-transferase CaiB-like acyl-CoA transferase